MICTHRFSICRSRAKVCLALELRRTVSFNFRNSTYPVKRPKTLWTFPRCMHWQAPGSNNNTSQTWLIWWKITSRRTNGRFGITSKMTPCLDLRGMTTIQNDQTTLWAMRSEESLRNYKLRRKPTFLMVSQSTSPWNTLRIAIRVSYLY